MIEQPVNPESPRRLLPEVSTAIFDLLDKEVYDAIKAGLNIEDLYLEKLKIILNENPAFRHAVKGFITEDGKLLPGRREALWQTIVTYFALRNQAEADRMKEEFGV